jgi:hypothetical protein
MISMTWTCIFALLPIPAASELSENTTDYLKKTHILNFKRQQTPQIHCLRCTARDRPDMAA